MTRQTSVRSIALLAVLASCGERPPVSSPAAAVPDSALPAFEPPVVTNAESPVRYPPALFQQNIEGTVLLRLFVDSLGRLAPESTRVADGSGVSGLDSAALAAVPAMKFAPARRNGRPVATSFLQPIEFRRPERTSGDTER
jgi:TonB family protein